MDHNTMVNRATRKKHFSSTPGNNRGRAPKILAYCPHDPIADMSHPEDSVKVFVSKNKRIARCKNGHLFRVGGYSFPTGEQLQ